MLSLDTLSKLTTLVCLSVLITFIGCKSSKSGSSTESTPTDLTSLVQEKYGNSASITFNKSKSHALVSKTQKDKNAAFASVDFFVFDTTKREIILEDFINQGKVEWLDNLQILVSVTAGVTQDGATAGYTFNVTTRNKTPN